MNKIYTETELKNMKVADLRGVAKEYGIVGRWDMNKATLIASISHEQKIEVEANTKKETDSKSEKSKYIKNLEVGMLVAFNTEDKGVKKTFSAKVKEIFKVKCDRFEIDSRRIRLQAKNGKEYVVRSENIIWVKTGTRWPRGVWKMLKGMNQNAITDDNIKRYNS